MTSFKDPKYMGLPPCFLRSLAPEEAGCHHARTPRQSPGEVRVVRITWQARECIVLEADPQPLSNVRMRLKPPNDILNLIRDPEPEPFS